MITPDTVAPKAGAGARYAELRDRIRTGFEAIEDGYAAPAPAIRLPDASSAVNVPVVATPPHMGGGEMSLTKGGSRKDQCRQLHRPRQIRRRLREIHPDTDINPCFWAADVSPVVHLHSPGVRNTRVTCGRSSPA